MPYHPRSNWALHLEQREPQPNPQPLPAPVDGLDFLAPRQEPNRVIARAASTDEANPLAPKNTCGPNDNTGVCQKPTDAGSSITLPVVLGSVYVLPVFEYPIPANFSLVSLSPLPSSFSWSCIEDTSRNLSWKTRMTDTNHSTSGWTRWNELVVGGTNGLRRALHLR
jgi:hypothetical protein